MAELMLAMPSNQTDNKMKGVEMDGCVDEPIIWQ